MVVECQQPGLSTCTQCTYTYCNVVLVVLVSEHWFSFFESKSCEIARPPRASLRGVNNRRISLSGWD